MPLLFPRKASLWSSAMLSNYENSSGSCLFSSLVFTELTFFSTFFSSTVFLKSSFSLKNFLKYFLSSYSFSSSSKVMLKLRSLMLS